MNNYKIHIVSFAIPYPPDYGGVIDVFYKIKALWENDVEIILHCFEYERSINDELLKFCKKVYYYPRNKSILDFFSLKPFIVKSRTSSALLINLLKDSHPVLLEGIHSSFYLSKLLKYNRKVFLRTHNIEYKYYRALSKKETNFFRWFYYFVESIKLKKYEKKQVIKDCFIAAISPNDYLYFQSLNSNTIYLPAFHANEHVVAKSGKGNYILFHGNLSVNENINAAIYILKNICPKVNYSFVFAGKNPPQRLINKIKKQKNTQLIINPSAEKMKELIRNAHIHLLITFQDTGIKLKLINALFGGRFCLANTPMVKNTPLEPMVHIANTPQQFVTEIKHLMKQSFTEDLLNNRKHSLLKNVNNNLNVQKLITLLD
ncbi:MAG: glycosyltransferase [Bacteroidota bacterium]|nr:glycosyltransferase [Bacteroidota bacterium]